MLVVLSVCSHGFAIQSASAPPCRMGRGGGRHNPWNTESHAAPSPGRRVLSIADNPRDGPRAIKPALLLAMLALNLKKKKKTHPIGPLQTCLNSPDCVSMLFVFNATVNAVGLQARRKRAIHHSSTCRSTAQHSRSSTTAATQQQQQQQQQQQ